MITLLINWENVWECMITSIIGGFIASMAFLFFLLRFFRPSITISPYICFSGDKYIFKIVNKSIYHAFDAKCELFLMKPYHHTGGKSNVKILPVDLLTNNVTIINRNRRKFSKKDEFAAFALLFGTLGDVRGEIDKPQAYYEFKITVRHGLTGLADTFTQQFASPDVIKNEHKFCFGNSIDTIALNQSV